MRVAFIISRLSEYRLVGPVIDAALERRWHVECWHNYSRPRSGPKGYLFPACEAAPMFRNGRALVISYATNKELSAWLREYRVDVVVSMGTMAAETDGQIPQRRPTWICLQALLDTFLQFDPESLAASDVLALMSPWWSDWAVQHYAGAEQQLANCAEYVGFPEVDARALIDPNEVRRRWNIPERRPVVLLLPFARGFGHASFWPSRIFAEPSRLRRLLNVAVHRQPRFWREAMQGPNECDIVKAVRRFCDRQGGILLVKSREKAPIPKYMQGLADKCLYDESYYPPTILEALSIANVCLSYYSASAIEAAWAGVPNLCVTFRADHYLGGRSGGYKDFARFCTTQEGGVFQFSGVSTTLTPRDAVSRLNTSTFNDFTVDQAARTRYIGKFIGSGEGPFSPRLLDIIESSAKRGVTHPPSVVVGDES